MTIQNTDLEIETAESNASCRVQTLDRRDTLRTMAGAGIGMSLLGKSQLGTVAAAAGGKNNLLTAGIGVQVPVLVDPNTYETIQPSGSVHNPEGWAEPVGILAPAEVTDYFNDPEDDDARSVNIPTARWWDSEEYNADGGDEGIYFHISYQYSTGDTHTDPWETDFAHRYLTGQSSSSYHLKPHVVYPTGLVGSDYFQVRIEIEIAGERVEHIPVNERREVVNYAVPNPGIFGDILDELEDIISETDETYDFLIDAIDQFTTADLVFVKKFGQLLAAAYAHEQNDHVDITDEDDLVRKAAIHGIAAFEDAFEKAPQTTTDAYGPTKAVMMGPTVAVNQNIRLRQEPWGIDPDRAHLSSEVVVNGEKDQYLRFEYGAGTSLDSVTEVMSLMEGGRGYATITAEDLQPDTLYSYRGQLLVDSEQPGQEYDVVRETITDTFRTESEGEDDDTGSGW